MEPQQQEPNDFEKHKLALHLASENDPVRDTAHELYQKLDSIRKKQIILATQHLEIDDNSSIKNDKNENELFESKKAQVLKLKDNLNELCSSLK